MAPRASSSRIKEVQKLMEQELGWLRRVWTRGRDAVRARLAASTQDTGQGKVG